MVLNSKGQVTIPAHLRAKYGLHAGDELASIPGGRCEAAFVCRPAVAGRCFCC